MKKSINTAARTVTFTFEGLEPVIFHAARASATSETIAQLFGWTNKIGDCAAIQKSAENSYRVTEAMRRAEIEAAVKHHEAGGEWNVRAAGPKAAPLNAAVLEIAQKLNCSYDMALAMMAQDFIAKMNTATETTIEGEVTDVTPKGETLMIEG
jgi:hypothetical protein